MPLSFTRLFCLVLALFLAAPALAFEFTPRPERIDLEDQPGLEQRISERLNSGTPLLHCLNRLRGHTTSLVPEDLPENTFHANMYLAPCTAERQRLELRSLTLGIRAFAVALEQSGTGLPAEQAQMRIFDDISRHGIDMALITPAIGLARLSMTEDTGLAAARRANMRRLANLALAHITLPDAVLGAELDIFRLPDDNTREICKCYPCAQPSDGQKLVNHQPDLLSDIPTMARVEGWGGSSADFGFTYGAPRLIFETGYLGQFGARPEISMSMNHIDSMAAEIIESVGWNPMRASDSAFPDMPSRTPFEWMASGDLGANLLQLAGQPATCYMACENRITDNRQTVYKSFYNTAKAGQDFADSLQLKGKLNKENAAGFAYQLGKTTNYLSEIENRCIGACQAASGLSQALHTASTIRANLHQATARVEGLNHQIAALPAMQAKATATLHAAQQTHTALKNSLDRDGPTLNDEDYQTRDNELKAAAQKIKNAEGKLAALPEPKVLQSQLQQAQAVVDELKAAQDGANKAVDEQRKKVEDAVNAAQALEPDTTPMEGGCMNPAMPREPFTKCVFKDGTWVLVPDQDAINAQVYLQSCARSDPAEGYICVVRGGRPVIVPLFADYDISTDRTPLPSNGCAVLTLREGDLCQDTPLGPEITWAPDIAPELGLDAVSPCAWVDPPEGYECVPTNGPMGYALVSVQERWLSEASPAFVPHKPLGYDPCITNEFNRVFDADLLRSKVILGE